MFKLYRVDPSLGDPGQAGGAPTSWHLAVFEYGRRRFRVRIWTQSEWDRLSDPARPAAVHRVPGVGWVEVLPLGRTNPGVSC
jgi:hypothetical protein